MGLPARLADVLKRERLPYTVFRHPPAFTALEQAQASHIRGRCAAKVVICMADDKPIQAIVPAHYRVDLERLRQLAGAFSIRLALEEEMAAIYPEFEVGAAPPVGTIYGHRVFVEECFVGEPEMVFDAGSHTVSVCMHFSDYVDMVKPVIGVFGIRPGRPRANADPLPAGV